MMMIIAVVIMVMVRDDTSNIKYNEPFKTVAVGMAAGTPTTAAMAAE